MADQGTWSNYQVEKWLQGLDNCWAALHLDNPMTASAYASEVNGGSYSRKQMKLTEPSSRSTWNSNVLTWAGLPMGLLTYLGIWDVQYNGNLLGAAPLPSSYRVLAGGTYSLPANQLALSFRSFG